MKKQKYINTIWLIVAVVSFFVLVGTAFGHMNEISLKQWGHSFEADYIEDGINVYAEYYDENQQLHTFNLNGHSPVHNGNKITMYYATNIDEATPENTLSSQLGYYIVFGALFAVSMWKIRKVAKS